MYNLLKKLIALILIITVNIPFEVQAQEKFHLQTISISIKGTSTLHDWEMKSDKGVCEAVVAVNKDKITFSSLNFKLPANSLKSGHNMMDKNTYKALDVTKNPDISFVLTSATVTPKSGNVYQFKGVGNLTIAGTTKATDLSAVCNYNAADKSFVCTGTKKFKMTEYNVKPPTVMMGTIKTGNDISITYELKIKQ